MSSAPLDLIGVGFGPSNLGLAIAVEEVAPWLRVRFMEQQERFGWHRGMLLEGATMQVAFLKDLAMMRDPTSSYSFVNYLHERQRLVEFVNHKTLFPTRVEFHDYLEWAAARQTHQVSYGTRVLSVTEGGGPLQVIADGPAGTIGTTAWNVVAAVGITPFLPAELTPSSRVWHSSQLLHRLAEHDAGPDRRDTFVVIGAGQSAAEVTEHLHSRYPQAQVHAVFSRYGYSPADDSPFANRIFNPSAVDDYFTAGQDVRALLDHYHANTNYSVVDSDLIDELYRRSYAERVSGTPRLHVHSASRATGVAETADGVSVAVCHLPTARVETVHAQHVVCATGYQPQTLQELLSGLDHLCLRDAAGRLLVDRDYRVRTRGDVPWSLYLQGGTEHTHGLSSSLLSNTATRAGEVLASITQRVPSRPVAASA